MRKKMILTAAELLFLKKFTQREPFEPTPEERAIFEDLKKKGLLKAHRDGSIELTIYGADRYIESRYGPAA